jgi:hypothetical protein
MLEFRRTVLNSVNLIHHIASQSRNANWNEFEPGKDAFKIGGDGDSDLHSEHEGCGAGAVVQNQEE